MSEEMKKVEEETIEDENLEEDLPESTDWKAEALKARGIAKRYQTKFEKTKEAKAPEVLKKEDAKPVEKEGFDWAEKAYLKASNISPDEFDFVYEVMQETGKSLDDVLEAKYFQAELKERRDAKSVKDAIPKGTKRSSTTQSDSVEYWVAKLNQGSATLMDIPDVMMRRQVNNAMLQTARVKSRFTDRPVA